MSFKQGELYLYRAFMLIVLIFHIIKYLWYEFTHW